MKKIIFIFIIIAVAVFFIFSITKSVEGRKTSLNIKPSIIYPGDPIMLTVSASSSVAEVRFDNKTVPNFIYKKIPTAFIAIPFEEKVLKHKISVKLSNGYTIEKQIDITERIKTVRPLGIPAKLGGNTPQAGKALVDNLALDNKSINENSLKTSTTTLWSDIFGVPVLDPKITDDYGYNRDTEGYTIVHKGTDYHATVGTEVLAINSGKVLVAQTYVSYGNTVIVDHGLGVTSLYMHLSELKVKKGDKVNKGQVIGLSGQTGYALAPHLHLSIKIRGVSIDPAKFLSFFM